MKYGHLSRQQIENLLRVARQESERDFLMILLGFHHGLRASEVCVSLVEDKKTGKMRLSGIEARDVRDGYLAIRRLKGSNATTQRLVHCDNPLFDERLALTAWIKEHGFHGKDKLFNISRIQFYRVFRQHCKAAGIPEHLAHPHVLKHSCAMNIIHKAGVENVRQRLGHVSLNSTGAYLRVSDQEADRAYMKATNF